jgi:integrase
MSKFTPRSGKSNYIKPRGKKFFYRRVIPTEFRQFFDGKTEWNIELEATTDAGRKSEAGALAHRHNGMLVADFDKIAPSIVDNSKNLKLDFSPENMPVNMTKVPPFQFYRDGKMIETYKVAGSDDPEFLRQAESEGYFIMSGTEWMQQAKLKKLQRAVRSAENPDAKALAKLRYGNTRRAIDDLAPAGSDTLRSILPKMHDQNQPGLSARASHYRAIEEFISLHGNLPLASIKKKHVADYVAYMATVMVKGQPLAPTTVKQRLDKLVAILQFAASVDAVEYNVGKAVNAPKDTRPLGDQVYKPFTKVEVTNLIRVGTLIWTKRRYQSQKTQSSRETDFITALHMLTWTGARPEEICQLRLDDVDMKKMGFVITNVSDDLGVRVRMVKNEDSVRSVPIHRKLLSRLAVHIDHVKKVSNSGLLFPSFEPENDTGRYARPIGNEWSQCLRKHVSDDPQKVLYSLRHSWAGESTDVGMSETMRNAIMGHASDSASSSAKRYRHHFKDLENQLAWINRMDCVGG